MSILSIIIISYNVCHLLSKCIDSIITTISESAIEYEIIILDNASYDKTVKLIQSKYPHINLIAENINFGFAVGNNKAFSFAKGEYILLINPDTIICNDAISKTLNFLKSQEDTACVSCRLLNPDLSLQSSIRYFPTIKENLWLGIGGKNFTKNHYPEFPLEIDYAMGAFLMLRRVAIVGDKIFDPTFFMYGEEKDLCKRLWKDGWKVKYFPDAEIIHYGGQSAKTNSVKYFIELQKSHLRFYHKHYKPLYRLGLFASHFFILFLGVFKSIIKYVIQKKKDDICLFFHSFVWYLKNAYKFY
jgi:GT2 family glycosyltransferase